MRLRLDLGYEGTEFHGWAAQPGLRTVEGSLRSALARVLRVEPPQLTCAGRTDAGVHARGQVAHLDVDRDILAASAGRSTAPAPQSLRRRANGVLPDDVRVHGCAVAPAGFDARFSALWRRYAYRVADSPDLLDPLERRHVLAWPRELDLASMNRAAPALLGEHDFAAFCRPRQHGTTVRGLIDLTWLRDDSGRAVCRVAADAFCHNMVRALVGCLIVVGEGRRPPGWPAEVLRGRTRDPRVSVVPAHGLTLEEVGYPPDDQVGARAAAARSLRTVPSQTLPRPTGAGPCGRMSAGGGAGHG